MAPDSPATILRINTVLLTLITYQTMMVIISMKLTFKRLLHLETWAAALEVVEELDVELEEEVVVAGHPDNLEPQKPHNVSTNLEIIMPSLPWMLNKFKMNKQLHVS